MLGSILIYSIQICRWTVGVVLLCLLNVHCCVVFADRRRIFPAEMCEDGFLISDRFYFDVSSDIFVYC